MTFKWAASPTPHQDTVIIDKASSTSDDNHHEKTKAFMLEDISMEIPRGRLVALVGRVGSGKSSLLQGVRARSQKLS